MTLFLPDIVAHGDDNGFSFWVTGHYYEHQAFQQSFLAAGNNTLPDYDLFGWAPDKTIQAAWLQSHEAVHDALRQALGLTGPDYSDVDFAVKREFDDWMWYHSQEHVAIRQALGLT